MFEETKRALVPAAEFFLVKDCWRFSTLAKRMKRLKPDVRVEDDFAQAWINKHRAGISERPPQPLYKKIFRLPLGRGSWNTCKERQTTPMQGRSRGSISGWSGEVGLEPPTSGGATGPSNRSPPQGKAGNLAPLTMFGRIQKLYGPSNRANISGLLA